MAVRGLCTLSVMTAGHLSIFRSGMGVVIGWSIHWAKTAHYLLQQRDRVLAPEEDRQTSDRLKNNNIYFLPAFIPTQEGELHP